MKHVVTAAALRQSILVTGFGAFPGAQRNPTATLMADLGRNRARLERLGIGLDCVLLPVVYAEIETKLREAVDRTHPDAILHFGLASRRKRISLETRAINRAGPLHPDAAGAMPRQTLARGGAGALRATYPAVRILAAMRRQRLDAVLSIDAGDYVCNATLYRALIDNAARRVGFIHVPHTRRPMAVRNMARPSRTDLTRAAMTAILETARSTGHKRWPDRAADPWHEA